MAKEFFFMLSNGNQDHVYNKNISIVIFIFFFVRRFRSFRNIEKEIGKVNKLTLLLFRRTISSGNVDIARILYC